MGDRNQWTIRAVVVFLGLWSIEVVSVLGFLSAREHPIQDGWWTLAAVGPTALAALLASTRTKP